MSSKNHALTLPNIGWLWENTLSENSQCSQSVVAPRSSMCPQPGNVFWFDDAVRHVGAPEAAKHFQQVSRAENAGGQVALVMLLDLADSTFSTAWRRSGGTRS